MLNIVFGVEKDEGIRWVVFCGVRFWEGEKIIKEENIEIRKILGNEKIVNVEWCYRIKIGWCGRERWDGYCRSGG